MKHFKGLFKIYNKLMIVAHPDDEIIFGGAQLLEDKGKWKVICVTNGDNKKRRKEFKKVMKKVGADFEIWDYKDKWKGSFNKKRLKSDLKKALNKRPLKKVVTHDLSGEYGHTQHITLSKIVHKIVKENLYTFDKSKKKLDKKLLRKKRRLLRLYKSQDIDWLGEYIAFECVKRVTK